MSRISSFSSFVFVVGFLAWLTATAGNSIAQQTSADQGTPAPTIRNELACGQPFLSLLDDVTIKGPREKNYFSLDANCELNAPHEFTSTNEPVCSADANNKNYVEIDEHYLWSTLLTYSCYNPSCDQCSTLVFTNSPPDHETQSCFGGLSWEAESTTTSSCQTHGCPQCDGDSDQDTTSESYCEQVAELLATTINGSQASFDVKSEAIKLAMQMVADKTQADAELKIREIEAAHQQQIQKLQDQLSAASDHQLQPDTAQSSEQPAVHQRTSGDDSPKHTPVYDRSLIPSRSPRMASKMLAETRARQIVELKQEIEMINARLDRLTSRSVRPASHLEPVFVPNKELVPIPDSPDRNSYRKLEPIPRLRSRR